MARNSDYMHEWSNFQVPHTGIAAAEENEHVRTDNFVTFMRKSDMVIANFGALNLGIRMSDDYSRTELTYITKDELADINVITADDGPHYGDGMRGTTVDYNPYVWGSTVKKVRDDQFFRMDMEHPPTSPQLLSDDEFNTLYPAGEPADIAKPKFDVMDTKEIHSGMDLYKNYPSEGWRSFGGKYDFLPYTGVLGKPRGNARV